MQKTKLATAHATDERSIASPYLRRISVHPAFSSSGRKDDSHLARENISHFVTYISNGLVVLQQRLENTLSTSDVIILMPLYKKFGLNKEISYKTYILDF